MSAIKGAATLVVSAMALYAGIRAIDCYAVRKQNLKTMAAEKAICRILDAEFFGMTRDRKERLLSLKAVQDALTEFQQGARTEESLKTILDFQNRHFA